MQWSRISANDADCITEKSHELISRAIVCDGVCFAAGCFGSRGQLLFSGAMIYNAAQPNFAMNPLAEGAVTIGWPAFRAPAASGTQHNISLDSKTSQELQDKRFLNGGYSKNQGRDAISSANPL